MDWAQQEFDCCGSYNVTDYPDPNSNKAAFNYTGLCDGGGVSSCYSNKTCDGVLYKKGCERALANFLKDNMIIIGAVAFGIAFIEVSCGHTKIFEKYLQQISTESFRF